ncbi:MAG: rhodanese-like domain-containing protein [Sideroxyarcus sp.]
MKSISIASVVLSGLFLGANAFAYDVEMAAKIEPIVAKMDQAALAKGGSKIAPEDVLKMLAEKKDKFTILDIRTKPERDVVGLTLPGALNISLNDLFKKENLDRLPKDGKILIVCHSGARAAGAAALLGAIGFDNAYYVNGGLISMVTAVTPKSMPLEK